MSAAEAESVSGSWRDAVIGRTAFVRTKEENLFLLVKVNNLLFDARRDAWNEKIEDRIDIGFEADSWAGIKAGGKRKISIADGLRSGGDALWQDDSLSTSFGNILVLERLRASKSVVFAKKDRSQQAIHRDLVNLTHSNRLRTLIE